MTPTGAAPAPPSSPLSPTARRRTRRRFWLLLAVALLASLLLFPPVWQAAVRQVLTWQAARRGWELSIGLVDGGLFDATTLHNVRIRRNPLSSEAAENERRRADLRIERLEMVPQWGVPFLHRAPAPWLRRLTIDGLSGVLDLSADPDDAKKKPAPAPKLRRWLDWLPLLAAKCLPADLELLNVDCQLQRGDWRLQWRGARLTAYQGESGQFFARELQINGPGFENTLPNRHGRTLWKETRLTLTDLPLGRGVTLERITLNGANLSKRQFQWDGDLTALGGTVRSQGTATLTRGRLTLNMGGALEKVEVRPLARLLGIKGPTDGRVDQGQYSFSGNPERPAAATISLVVNATDFRWGQRRWQSLNLAAIVVKRRVQVSRLELRQSRNQLSFNGECTLPSGEDEGLRWLQDGFSGNIDAKLDDLRALAQLLGPGWPEISGRMSVNGRLAARNQGQALDGYLNVEGSDLSILGAPLDYLRSTLLFKGDELQVADLQATHAATDYFTGKGAFKIIGLPRYQAEFKAAIYDLATYYPAYKGPLCPQPINGQAVLDWSGDGAPGAHSGAFRGNVEKFFTKEGPGAMARPVHLEAEATYSPVSLSFRRFSVKEGEGAKRHEALKAIGALPLKSNPQASGLDRWVDLDAPLTLRVECTDAPLDLLLPELAPAWVLSAEGQVGGWLDLAGSARMPRSNGALQFRKAAIRWVDENQPSIEALTADLKLDDSVLRMERCQGKRGEEAFELGGSADLHELANPVLDATLRFRRVARAVNNDFLRADADLTLNVRGLPRSPEISGEARLLDGEFFRRLEFTPATEELDQASVAFPVGSWLPEAWRDCQLNLHVTADKPLKIMARGNVGGTVAPDLWLTGSSRAPLATGRLEFRKTRLFLPWESMPIEEGTLYFLADQPNNPTLAVSTGKSGVYFYGPLQTGQTLPWGNRAAPRIGEADTDPPAEWPSQAKLEPASTSPVERLAEKVPLLPEAGFEAPALPLVLRLR